MTIIIINNGPALCPPFPSCMQVNLHAGLAFHPNIMEESQKSKQCTRRSVMVFCLTIGSWNISPFEHIHFFFLSIESCGLRLDEPNLTIFSHCFCVKKKTVSMQSNNYWWEHKLIHHLQSLVVFLLQLYMCICSILPFHL